MILDQIIQKINPKIKGKCLIGSRRDLKTTTLVSYLFQIWLSKDDVLNMLALTTYSLQRATEIFDQADLVLTDAEALEASQCLSTHLEAYAWLADHYYQRRLMMYKIRCKSHYMWHVSWEVARYKLNQNLFHTFQEESWLGKFKTVAAKCHGRTWFARVYQRYFLALAIYFHEYKQLELSL